MLDTDSVWTRGIIAGIIGATVLAVWFLLIDASQGAPFRTPALLANAFLDVDDFAARPGPIALYTLIHYASFVVVGVVVTKMLGWMKLGPSVIFGLVLGFLLFDIAFFGSMATNGIDIVGELGWVEVLSGNMLAGMALMAYLRVTDKLSTTFWWEELADREVVREGVVAGVVGAVAVAAWFLIVDGAQGRPFFTPAALGSALFLGVSDLGMVEVTFLTVGGYTVFHFLAFVVVGMLASAIAGQAEKTPALLLGAMLLFVTFEAFVMGLLAVVAEFLLGPLAWWSIAIGNLFAVIAMGYYLWRKHPKLRAALNRDPFDKTD